MAELFVKRSRRTFGNTLAIVSNDAYVRSESIAPIKLCSISLRLDCVTENSVTETILTLETIIWKQALEYINNKF